MPKKQINKLINNVSSGRENIQQYKKIFGNDGWMEHQGQRCLTVSVKVCD
jgi:hypothetical protein